jgi:ribosomal-protein-alanine N-acetyltransferase
MDGSPELRTSRLLLRRWRPTDRAPFAELNADPVVMEHFPHVLTRAESDAFVDRIEAGLEERGYGLWAVEVPGVAAFIGFVGLNPAIFEAHFTPALEVGWRIDQPYWGAGYATEGGRAALAFAFEELGEQEVVSFTSVGHTRSRAVMERLGMTRDPADDFEHPNVPEGHPIRPHVLYRIDRTAWEQRT